MSWEEEPIRERIAQMRICLRCRESFESAGPDNRICPPCAKKPVATHGLRRARELRAPVARRRPEN